MKVLCLLFVAAYGIKVYNYQSSTFPEVQRFHSMNTLLGNKFTYYLKMTLVANIGDMLVEYQIC